MPSPQEIHFVNNCLTCIPVALFFYDWALTLGDEVELIWRRKLSGRGVQLIFLLLRYGTLASIGMLGSLFNKNTSAAEHRRLTTASIAITILIFSVAQVLLQFRVYVIYGRSRLVLWTNLALMVTEIGISTFVFVHLFSHANLTCHTETCSAYPSSFGLVYVAPLVYETYLLALAAYKTWVQRETFRSLGPTNILDVLIRGSVLYFALVASAIALAIIIFFAAPQYVDWLDLLSDTTASIGGTRLIISTRQAVRQPRLPVARGSLSATLCDSDATYSVRGDFRKPRKAERSRLGMDTGSSATGTASTSTW